MLKPVASTPRLAVTDAERREWDAAAETGVPPRFESGARIDKELLAMLPDGDGTQGVTRLHVIIRSKGQFPFERFTATESALIVNARDEDLLAMRHLPSLRALSLIAPRVQSLAALADGSASLQHVAVEDSAVLEDPSGLDHLHGLRTLTLVGNDRMSEFPELGSAAASLRGLVVRATRPGSRMRVQSLAPIAAARDLRYLDLRVPVADCSLAPLRELSRLEYLEILPKKFPAAEIESLRAAFPNVRGGRWREVER